MYFYLLFGLEVPKCGPGPESGQNWSLDGGEAEVSLPGGEAEGALPVDFSMMNNRSA